MDAQSWNRHGMCHWLFFFAVAVCIASPFLTTVAKANESGVAWLLDQQGHDGRMAAPADETTPPHASLEALRALHAVMDQGEAWVQLQQSVEQASGSGIPDVARRLIALSLSGELEAEGLAELRRHQNPDGGFAAEPGQQSSVLDTLDPMDALAAAGLSDFDLLQPAFAFLGERQRTDGGFAASAESPSSVYLTARAVAGLQRYRIEYGLSGMLQGAIDFLAVQENNGDWGRNWQSAQALLALLPSTADTGRHAVAVDALRAAQGNDGAWDGIVYATALALRALGLAAAEDPSSSLASATLFGQVIDSRHGLDLDQEETRFIPADWRIDAPAGTKLVAVLRAEIRGDLQTLASASIRVEDRFVSSPTVEGRGRLLVLLDPPVQHECLAVEQLGLALPRLASLGYGDLLQLDLYDATGYLLDSESLRGRDPLPSDLSQGEGLNLILQDRSTQGMIVAIDFRDGRALQTDRFQLIATFHEGGFVRQFTSGMVPAGCVDLPDTGDVLGDFRARDAAIVAEGPSLRRRAFLEALRDTEGWSYTVVTHAFARELRTGGYGSFFLLAERVKLDNQVTRELREAVFAGRGIVQAGARDHRNRHLLEVFGAELLGIHPHAVGIHPVVPAPIAVPDDAFAAEERAVALRLHGGRVIGEYRIDGGQALDSAAIVVHDFGLGRSLLAGFDLLAASKASGVSGGFAALLRDTLEYTRPDPVVQGPGMAIPIRWVLANRGDAGSVLLDLALIGGAIADPGPATAEGSRHLSYEIDLPAGGQGGTAVLVAVTDGLR